MCAAIIRFAAAATNIVLMDQTLPPLRRVNLPMSVEHCISPSNNPACKQSQAYDHLNASGAYKRFVHLVPSHDRAILVVDLAVWRKECPYERQAVPAIWSHRFTRQIYDVVVTLHRLSSNPHSNHSALNQSYLPLAVLSGVTNAMPKQATAPYHPR